MHICISSRIFMYFVSVFYVTNLALSLQETNKTYLLRLLPVSDIEVSSRFILDSFSLRYHWTIMNEDYQRLS